MIQAYPNFAALRTMTWVCHIRAMASGKAKVVEGRNGEEYFRISFAGPTASTGKVEL